jgi:hypothetical protein
VNGAFGRQELHDSAGIRAVTAAPRLAIERKLELDKKNPD